MKKLINRAVLEGDLKLCGGETDRRRRRLLFSTEMLLPRECGLLASAVPSYLALFLLPQRYWFLVCLGSELGGGFVKQVFTLEPSYPRTHYGTWNSCLPAPASGVTGAQACVTTHDSANHGHTCFRFVLSVPVSHPRSHITAALSQTAGL